MANTPNMLIPIDVPGSTAGSPSFQWATDNEIFKTIVDAHQHLGTPGSGLQIVTAAMNINAALPFNSNDATLLRSTRYVSQAAALALGTDVGCLYNVLGDLYWNNGSGTAVKITAGSAINSAGIGGITGLGGTSAAVTYNLGLTDFIFTNASLQSAAIDCGAVTIRQTATTSAHGITLKSPNALAGDYNLTLLTALPAVTLPLTVDSTGQVSTSAAAAALPLASTAVASAPTPSAGNASLYVDSLSGKVSAKDSTGSGLPLYMAVNNTISMGSFSTVETIIAGGKTGGANAPNGLGFQIPANALKVGSVIRVRVVGSCASTVANTVTFNLRCGVNGTTADGVLLTVAPGITSGTDGTNTFSADIYALVTAIGASATLGVFYLELAQTTATHSISGNDHDVARATNFTAFNSTVANYMELTLKSAASTTAFTIQGATMELI